MMGVIGAAGRGLRVTVSPTNVVGVGQGTVTTTTMTATVTGGSPPYAYNWVLDIDDGMSPVLPSSAATAFRKTDVGPGDIFTNTATVTVTDSNALTSSDSGTVSISGL